MRTIKHYEDTIKLAQALPPDQAGELLTGVVIQVRADRKAVDARRAIVEAQANKLLADLGEEMRWTDTQQFPKVRGQLVHVAGETNVVSYPIGNLRGLAARSPKFRRALAKCAKKSNRQEKWVVKKF